MGVSGDFGTEFRPSVWNDIIKYQVNKSPTAAPSTDPSKTPPKVASNKPFLSQSPSDVPTKTPSMIPSQ